jgi:hypothetical protein
MNLIEHINTHEFLYLVHVGEPREHTLRLVIQEARANLPPQGDPGGETPTRSWGSIVPTSGCAAYEVVFDSVIAYCVWDESLSATDPAEAFTGRVFRIFSKSRFLNYVRGGVLAIGELYPGPYQHFEIVCLNHIVDIASVTPPSITILPER